LKWREDSSNESIKYIRNKIRHKVVPVLKELNPNLLDSFSKTMQNLNGSKQIVFDYLDLIKAKVMHNVGNETYFKVDELNKLTYPKPYLFEIFKTYNFTEWDDIYNLLNAQTGKYVISKTHRLLKNRDHLILSPVNIEKSQDCCTISQNVQAIDNPIDLQFEIVEIPFDTKNNKTKVLQELINNSDTTMVFDFNLLQFPLTLRKWQKGDYFYPIGLSGKKKISKYFKDQKLSLFEKENTWLLCSGNDIIWLVGKRMDDRFKVTPKTSTLFKIKYNKSNI
jgi:tRNA(Ile)-lysidine synthase